MDRAEKVKTVNDLKEKLKLFTGVFVADYRGLTVAEVNELRKAFRKADVEYRVVKNTLIRRALEGTALDVVRGEFKGTTAVAIAKTDVVGAAKAAVDFAKNHEKFKLRVAFVEGQILAADAIKQLSTMPSQTEIRSQVLGLIQAPFSKLLAQINAPAQQLVGIVQAKIDKDNQSQATG